MAAPYRVGIVGLTPPGSWAAVAHLPAIAAMPDEFVISGVANSSAESARAAAAECAIPRAFESVDELVGSDDVDIVVVTVKAPHHFPVVEKALRAGKHVFCEWPLGNGYDETRRLAELAREMGVRAVVGAQAPYAPAVRFVRELVADGYVGEVLSTTVVGDGGTWGPSITAQTRYVLDAANGATMLTVPVGHTLVGITSALGPIEHVQAFTATRRPTTVVAETGEIVPILSPDQIIVAATLDGGVPMSLHYRGGLSTGSGFRWEILGTAGELEITGPMGAIEMVDLTVTGARAGETSRTVLDVPAHHRGGFDLDVIPGNVARLYRALHADLESGSASAFSFDDAEKQHRVLAAIDEAASQARPVAM